LSGKKNIKFVSPVGTLRYPRITEADTGGQYSDGKYKTQLLVPKKEAQAFIKELQAIAKEELKGVKSPQMPFKADKEDEDTIVFVAKSKFQPLIFDGKGKQVKKITERVAGGTTARIAGSVFPYNEKGLSLQFKQVQVLSLVTGAQSMFDQMEGEFDASEFDKSDEEKSFDGGSSEGDAAADGPDI
jgi:hypothetical protein